MPAYGITGMRWNRFPIHGILLFFVIIVSCFALNEEKDSGKNPAKKSCMVAILNEPGFPRYLSGNVLPESLGKALEQSGVDYRFYDVDTLVRKDLLSIDNFKAFVHVYGNTFPKDLIEPLRRFRSQGGIFVSTGIPLTHPVEGKSGSWKDCGHTESYARHKDGGLGTGLFWTAAPGLLRTSTLGDKLGLRKIDWSSLVGSNTRQGLNTASLDPKDRVEAVLFSGADDKPYIALINHQCEPFKGAVDIWAGMADPSMLSVISDYMLSEVISRTLLYALAQKGLLSQEHLEKMLKQPFREDIMNLLNTGFAPRFISGERKRLYPVMGKKPEQLICLDVRKLAPEEKPLAACAQGLLNSDPKIGEKVYLIWNDDDTRWLDWLKTHAGVKSVKNVKSIQDLLSLGNLKNCVLIDEKPSHSLAIALSIAGSQRLLIAMSDSIVKKYGLTVEEDIRGRWKTNIEAYEYILDHYSHRSDLLAMIHPAPSLANLMDYIVGTGTFTFWVSGSVDSVLPGSDPHAEETFFSRILAERFPVNIPVIGYPWNGNGVGIGENGGVTLLSRAGKFLVPLDRVSNASVLTCFPPQFGPLEKKPSRTVLDKNKYYGSVLITDGDNLCTFRTWFPNYWKNLKDKDFPVAWTLGPTLRELLPPFYDNLKMTAPPGDSFGTGVSGVGYIAPSEYARSFGDKREKVIEEFMKLTARYMNDVGERWLWIMRYGGPRSLDLDYYAKYNDGTFVAILGGYGREARDGQDSAETVGEIPIFHSVTDNNNMGAIQRQLEEIIKNNKPPLFLNITLQNWAITPEMLKALAEFCAKAGIVLVTPEDMALLYKESLKK